MMKYYGRVSVERMYMGTQNEKMVYALCQPDGKMRELRWHNPATFPSLDNSPFKQYVGKDVEVVGRAYNTDVILVSRIAKFP